jgi:hypothetical protein
MVGPAATWWLLGGVYLVSPEATRAARDRGLQRATIRNAELATAAGPVPVAGLVDRCELGQPREGS